MRTPHTVCRSGKRVYVKLKDGTEFIERFKEKRGNRVFFEKHQVHHGDIIRFVIYKPRTHEQQ